MELNREKLKRMFEDTNGNGGSANGGGGGGSLAGYATQAWVNEGFVSVDFFNRLFTVYGPGETSSDPDVVIEPNDLDSTIKNIKAMFGLWTEQYLSALGLNPGGTGSATSLGMLDDVNITTPTNGQALVYNATSLKWENATISTVTALANLTDVLLTSVADQQFLKYDSTSQKWINTAMKTINGQSLIGSGDISVGGGASGNYLPLTGGTLVGKLYINRSGSDAELLTLKATNATYNCISFQSVSTSNVNWSVGNDVNNFYFWNSQLLTSALVISNNGNIGVGTMSPNYPLHIVCNSGDFIYAKTNTTFCGISYHVNGRSVGWSAGSNNSDNFYFYNDYINRSPLIITSGGNIGIGIDAPLTPIHISSTAGDLIRLISTSASYCCLNIQAGSSNEIWSVGSGDHTFYFYNSYVSRSVVVISRGGNVGINTITPSYALHVVGSIYATGAITALSDIKQKNIKEYMQLGIEEVANAPVIKFTWKDPKAEDKGLQVGSIAQYWEKVLPEAVKKDKDGTLSMSYGVVALVAAVSTAKKVQDHERRIADLERENKELKVRLRRLNRYGEQ